MLGLIRGAGDLASGIALRLHHAGMHVVMTDLPQPTAIRRTVSFARAITEGQVQVEDVTATYAPAAADVKRILAAGEIAVLADPQAACRMELAPDALVDAILAKRNTGTTIQDAPVVIGVGPGFTAGLDCHAVVETMRGHTLGRVYYQGSAMENTAVPRLIGGYAGERVLRAPADGVFHQLLDIGAVLRGILADGVPVTKGMKAGDVDPRCKVEYCYTASDKALAVGGGVLEALLHLQR